MHRWGHAVVVAGLGCMTSGCAQPFSATASDGGGTEGGGTEGGVGSDSGDDGAGSAPITLATGQGVPGAITADATRIFWVNREDPNGGPGSVRTRLKDGSGPVGNVASDQTAPLDIGIQGNGLFWSVNNGTAVPAAAMPQCLVMTTDKVAMTAPSCVMTGPFAPSRMALSVDRIFLVAQGTFVNATVPFVGYGQNSQFSSKPTQGPAAALAGTLSDVYVGNANGTHIDDFQLPTLAVGPALCSDACGNGTIADLLVDAALGRAFWITTKGDVMTLQLSMPNQPMSLGTVAGTPQRMARDSYYLYVASQQPGTITAVPVSGGAASRTLATGEHDPFGIAADGTTVYWTCSDGTVRSAPAPAH